MKPRGLWSTFLTYMAFMLLLLLVFPGISSRSSLISASVDATHDQVIWGGMDAMTPISLTITLDFEDGQLPDAHGWHRIVGDEGVNTIITGTVPGGPGTKVLAISGMNTFGWGRGLEGIVPLYADWLFSVDLRCTGGCGGSEDVVIVRIGQGNGGYVPGLRDC